MSINIPERARGWLYIIVSIGSLVAAYALAKDYIGADEMALWSGFAAFVALVARFNLGNSPNDPPATP